jgi:mono/diheme cytochrome c family protein
MSALSGRSRAAIVGVIVVAWSVALLGGGLEAQQDKAQTEAAGQQIERGRYLVKITGCNDCHTEGYPEAGGNIPEERWLMGSALGWRGPWGTTYGTNLRIYMSDITEDEWVEIAQQMETRPPMPWFGVQSMSRSDLRAMYQFIRSLGRAGESEPRYVPPDKEPETPFVLFP